jgi:hypothetical protein
VDETTSYVYLGRRIIAGWAIQLVLIAALLPFLVGTIDLFARCRRRRIRLGGAVRALRARLSYWGFAALVVLAAARLGLYPDAESGRPVPLASEEVAGASTVGVALLLALLAVAWLVGREPLIPRRPATLEEKLAGYTVALLALGLLALLVVATNPYALIFLLPSLYAWLWLPQAHAAPALARAALFAAGCAGPLLLVASFGSRYDLGADAPSYLLWLVGTGYVPLLTALLGFAWAAIAAQLGALASGRYAAYAQKGSRPRRRSMQVARGRLTRKRLTPVQDDDAMEV